MPGLVMMMLQTQSTANASFGIYFPKFVGTIYELLSAPISFIEIVLGYVGAAATKSIILGLIILATAGLFVPLQIAHAAWMIAFLVLGGSILAYLLWFHLLKVCGATAASAYHFLMPPLGMLFAFLVLGEHVEFRDLLGIVPVALGIYLVTRPAASIERSAA
jgi:drug/metabolite transporter (DMT)-like permease